MSNFINSKESSLTTPEDRDKESRWKPDQFAAPLDDTQFVDAVKELNDSSFIQKFPRVDRTYADPAIPLQNYSLFSFMPAKGATPNDNGIFGFAKIRGSFASEIEANQRAEYLIKNVDSYNQIFHTYTGRPFPITLDSKYSAETTEVDIRKDVAKTVSQNIKDKKEDEYKTMQEIKQKEEALLADSKREDVDPYDDYITQRVKFAQLSFTYLEHQKKMTEIREIIIKTRDKIGEMDTEFPDFKTSYYEKYMDARKQAGIKESEEDTQTNFIKYLVQDAPLDF
jgi:hypothetical protein